ncbi:MAG: hypothetical protein H7Y10_03530 [Flavobacterium sp.]|nr:hypothetical protein [Flavobacterium sp.]
MERRTGKTTRLIDEAIQYLFEKGELYLFKKCGFKIASRSFISSQRIFIDPDHKMANQAQQDFIYRVMKRLEFEHKGSHKIKTMSKDYIHVITVKL